MFEFYSAPALEGDKVFLVHFAELRTAQEYFQSIAEKWQERKTRYRKESMDNIFRDKGWKVK